MVLTPENFVKTEFGMFVGFIFLVLGVLSLMRGSDKPRKSPTGIVLSLLSIVLGGYIVAKHFGYDF